MMQESNLRAEYFSRRFYSADLAFASAPPIGVSLRFSIHPGARRRPWRLPLGLFNFIGANQQFLILVRRPR